MRKIFFLGTVVMLYASTVLHAQQVYQENNNLFKTREIIKKASVYPNSKVMIRSAMSLSGEIRIETGGDNNAVIKYAKRAKSASKSQAIDFIDLISVDLGQTKDGIRIDLRAPNPAPWSGTDQSGSVEITIIIPEFCDVEFETPYFDVDAIGPFDSFIIPSTYGKVDIDNVIEKLDIVVTNRKVAIKNISGDIYVSTTNSTLEAENITSREGRVELRDDGGDILIENITGELYVKNTYGKIDIKKYIPVGDKNYISGSYGPIFLQIDDFTTEQLLVVNQYEDIDITIPDDISASLSLAVEEDGKIEVSDLKMKPDLIQENRLNMIVGDGKNLINGSVRGRGNIYLRGYKKGEE